MIAAAIVANALGLPPALCVGALGALWYGGEMVLAAAAEWHVPALYPLYGLMRDLLLPVLFVRRSRGSDFVWRGNEMQVERMRPRRMMARVRPRLQEVAAGSRRRLRALRAANLYETAKSDGQRLPRRPVGNRVDRGAVGRKIRLDPGLFGRAQRRAQSRACGTPRLDEIRRLERKARRRPALRQVASSRQARSAAPASERDQATSTRSANDCGPSR